jgi:hypothetical protein
MFMSVRKHNGSRLCKATERISLAGFNGPVPRRPDSTAVFTCQSRAKIELGFIQYSAMVSFQYVRRNLAESFY